jgi:TatA/E family protein of Tat protein translocase
MFGLGIGELILIFVIFLIFFGPDKLPDLAKNLGRGLAELRRTVDEIKFDMSTTDVVPPPTRTSAGPTTNLEAPPPSPVPDPHEIPATTAEIASKVDASTPAASEKKS